MFGFTKIFEGYLAKINSQPQGAHMTTFREALQGKIALTESLTVKLKEDLAAFEAGFSGVLDKGEEEVEALYKRLAGHMNAAPDDQSAPPTIGV